MAEVVVLGDKIFEMAKKRELRDRFISREDKEFLDEVRKNSSLRERLKKGREYQKELYGALHGRLAGVLQILLLRGLDILEQEEDEDTARFVFSAPEKEIAEAVEVSVPTLRKYLKMLQDMGFIFFRFVGKGKNRTVEYVIADKTFLWIEYSTTIAERMFDPFFVEELHDILEQV